MRVISLTSSIHPESKGILVDLTNMLLFDDSESVMNAAGTMGTLVCFRDMLYVLLSALCKSFDVYSHYSVPIHNYSTRRLFCFFGVVLHPTLLKVNSWTNIY